MLSQFVGLNVFIMFYHKWIFSLTATGGENVISAKITDNPHRFGVKQTSFNVWVSVDFMQSW